MYVGKVSEGWVKKGGVNWSRDDAPKPPAPSGSSKLVAVPATNPRLEA